SRYGLIAYASSFDQIGIFGINTRDVAKTLAVIGGADEYDATASKEKGDDYLSALSKDENKRYRFVYFNEVLGHPSLDKEISFSIKGTIDELIADGHEVEAVQLEYLAY